MGAVQRQPRGVLPPGTRVGRYELLRRLAKGGMAELYLARARGIHGFEKLVVLKLVLPHLAEDRQFVEMFLHEARLAATLDHPNIVHVTDIGEVDGEPFFVMEYVHGQDLASILRAVGRRKKPLPLGCALTIACGVAGGLHYVHERTDADGRYLGLVHRDVSPSNVVISYDGGIKLVDFGIAKATELAQATRAGVLKGKVHYMSPEQCHGGSIDRRTDVFSLGILLYETTTGQRLFSGDNDFHVMSRIVRGVYARPGEHTDDYPDQLEEIVMRALATEPEDRYPSARELLEDLQEFATQARISTSSLDVQRTLRDLFGDQPPPTVDDVDDVAPTALHPDSIQRGASLPSQIRTTAGSMQTTGLRSVSGDADGVSPTAVLPAVDPDATGIAAAPKRTLTEIRGAVGPMHGLRPISGDVEAPDPTVVRPATRDDSARIAAAADGPLTEIHAAKGPPPPSTVVSLTPSSAAGSTVVAPAPQQPHPHPPSPLVWSDSLEAVRPLGTRGWLWPVGLLTGAAAVALLLMLALGRVGPTDGDPARPGAVDIPAAVSSTPSEPEVIEAAPVPPDEPEPSVIEPSAAVEATTHPEATPADAPAGPEGAETTPGEGADANVPKPRRRRSSKRRSGKKSSSSKGSKLDSMYPGG